MALAIASRIEDCFLQQRDIVEDVKRNAQLHVEGDIAQFHGKGLPPTTWPVFLPDPIHGQIPRASEVLAIDRGLIGRNGIDNRCEVVLYPGCSNLKAVRINHEF